MPRRRVEGVDVGVAKAMRSRGVEAGGCGWTSLQNPPRSKQRIAAGGGAMRGARMAATIATMTSNTIAIRRWAGRRNRKCDAASPQA
jgi:hypothetical protein